ncbi:hypothetical protein SCUCBS95973_002830 [Sporothrix curviconia]|uniref:Major facilitator superfamily (MFS) profile domain-containing protein n=1 Tax=Sporothrix curviconia TaxID=1260050 RepID=A0ABP0BAK3_9PEZI
MGSTRFSFANIAIALALSLGSITYGYDFSIISTTVGQASWYAYFGLTADATQASLYKYRNQIIATVFGIFSAGAIFGALFVGWLCDRYGRRAVLVVAAVINIIGGALQCGSVHIGMSIAARFITGFSGSMFVTLVPIYIAEVAPPATRGLLIGQHGAFFLIGYVLAAWVGAAIVANYGSSTNKAALAAGVAMLFGYIVFYSSFVDTTIYVYGAEIFPTHIRAKGMGWCLSIFFLSTLPFLESSITGFATIGWKYYLLFIILPSINVVLIKLFCPETKGLSLEEINGLFNDKLTYMDGMDGMDGEDGMDTPGPDLDASGSSTNGTDMREKTDAKIQVV